jgi:hypothetical protein
MVSRFPAPALPDLRPALRLAGPARPVIGLQECGTAGLAARGRGAAPHQPQAQPRLGRPSRHGRAHPVPAGEAASMPPGHPGNGPAVAPPPDHQEMDISAQRRSAAGSPPKTAAGDTSVMPSAGLCRVAGLGWGFPLFGWLRSAGVLGIIRVAPGTRAACRVPGIDPFLCAAGSCGRGLVL